MNTILQNTKYYHLVQKPECCAVTCFAMILYRKTKKLYDIQNLAKFFEVKISPESKNAFNVDLETFTSFNNDEWISTLDSIEKINNFFKKENISLQAIAFKYSKINDLKQFIWENLEKWNDIWVEYHNDEIHPYDWCSAIHDSLIEDINTEENEVTLVDPEYNHKPRINIKIDILKNAISNNFWKETGFVIIQEIK